MSQSLNLTRLSVTSHNNVRLPPRSRSYLFHLQCDLQLAGELYFGGSSGKPAQIVVLSSFFGYVYISVLLRLLLCIRYCVIGVYQLGMRTKVYNLQSHKVIKVWAFGTCMYGKAVYIFAEKMPSHCSIRWRVRQFSESDHGRTPPQYLTDQNMSVTEPFSSPGNFYAGPSTCFGLRSSGRCDGLTDLFHSNDTCSI